MKHTFTDQEIDAFVDAIQQEAQPTTTVSFLQRRFRLGYVRASSAVEELEARGAVGPAGANGRRTVLVSIEENQGSQCQELRQAIADLLALTTETPFAQKLQVKRNARRLLEGQS